MATDIPPPAATITDRLTADMKTAMKSGDKVRLNAVRMLLSEARAADLQKPPSTPQAMVEAYHKRLVKGREEFARAGNAEQLAALDAELLIVGEYVPSKASEAETHVLVDDWLARRSEFGPKDAGKATGLFMREHGETVDAKLASARIREALAKR